LHVTQIRTNGLDITISVSCFIYCKYYSMLSYYITVCSNTHFFSTTLMTVVSYLILWLYKLSLLRFAMCFCCNFLIITWLSSIRSGIKLARFVWELTFYVIEIWGHLLWLTTNFFNHIKSVSLYGWLVPVHKFNNLCDGQVRYMDAALLFPRSLRLSR